MTAKELIHELPKGLIKWHSFEKGKQALYITAYTDLDSAFAEALSESGIIVECVSVKEMKSIVKNRYHYIVASSVVEKTQDVSCVQNILRETYRLLEKDGKLFLITENRLAIRYFCGDRDPFTERNFDGIENYRRVNFRDRDLQEGKLYSKAEFIEVLEKSGFRYHKFYSIFPDISCPQVIFAEDYIPQEELNIRIFPQYHNPDTVFIEEENLYTSFIKNGIFHAMANGFLIECPLNNEFSTVNQVTVSMDRGKENALCTIIRQNDLVEKKPLYDEGVCKLAELAKNSRYLQEHGIRMIEGRVKDHSYIMPYVNGIPLVRYFRLLAKTDKQKFYRQFDALWDLIQNSSEHISYDKIDWEHFNPMWDEIKSEVEQRRIDREEWKRVSESQKGKKYLGPILAKGFPDLVLVNGIMTNEGFVFFDQELYVKQFPAKAVMIRNIDFLYHGDNEIEVILPKKELLEHYGIQEAYFEIYYAHISHFLTKLRNDDILLEYHKFCRTNYETLHSNRQRMNYSAEEYQRIFVDIFKGLENRKLYLFGSGNFTRKFLAMYGEDYHVCGILDNDRQKWGNELEGIKIQAPSLLETMEPSTYKVIICIKEYTGVLRQIRKLGAKNIGIYETNMEYPRKTKRISVKDTAQNTDKKKYHVGYIAGVFDLFHMGHLNLLRRAKEQCDYLIVGVVTDEGVKQKKKTEGFIPFEERLAIVQSCKYVDEAVAIPLEYNDTKDAYLKFQFDVQFSGSDYKNDPIWLEKREFLRKHGAELVFFPYTESTSSTKIKEMIERKLV